MREYMRSLYFGSDSKGLGPATLFLMGFVPVYKLARFLNQTLRTCRRQELSTPVVSVGNISIGGTAKTSFVSWLCDNLVDEGYKPAVLKRGEGSREGIIGPDTGVEEAVDFGDEVALLAEALPSVPIGVGQNRYEQGRRVEEEFNVDCFVMDDGFQHRQLVRNLDVVLLGSEDELTRWELPAGPLREPPSALDRADVVSLRTSSSETNRDQLNRVESAIDLREDQFLTSHYYQFEGVYRDGENVSDEFRAQDNQLLTTQARPDRLETFMREQDFSIETHLKLADHEQIPTDYFDNNLDPGRTLVTDKEWVKLPRKLRREVGRIRSKLVVDPSDRLLRELMALVEAEPQ